MASRTTLLYTGVLLILLAVAYQYRTDITRFVRRYTGAGSTRVAEKEERKASGVSTQERQTPTPTTPREESKWTLDTESDIEIYNPPFDPDNPSEELRSKSGTRLFTKNELAAHGPNGPLKPILLAMLGRVYDVSEGENYYGPEGGYNFFAGIDGSRAYVTGEFNEEGLIDDLGGFTPLQIGEIDGWIKFYDKTYTYAGKLIGRYYNKDGSPTKEWYKTQDLLAQKEKMEAERKEMEKQFPGCNSRWNKEDGGYVFCSDKSGGVHRDWVGFPRRYFAPGSTSWRCSCVHERDLNSPHVKLYPDCDPKAVSCKVDTEKLKKLKS
jgi:predicted heme/steroid binding protein